MEFFRISVELVVGFFALLLLTKILGKTQITQITAFDFISALVLGELVGNALYDQKIGLRQVLFAIAVWGMLIFITEIVTQKSLRFRKALEGTPSIIVRNGNIIYDSLKKNHLDLNQLQHLLRLRGVFSIRECECAILETDGQVSVLKKAEYLPPSRQDLHIPGQEQRLPVPVILDGELIEENLKLTGMNTALLKQELQKQKIESMKDVLYADWVEGKDMHIQTY